MTEPKHPRHVPIDDEAPPAPKPKDVPAADVAAPKPIARDPKTMIGIGTVDPQYVPNPSGTRRDQQIQIGGQYYEHVAEDADGIWLYRPTT